MKRLLTAMLVCLRKPGQRPSQAGGEPRLHWKGLPVVERCQGSPAASPLATLTVRRRDRAAADTLPCS
jgi:hypothetical protein